MPATILANNYQQGERSTVQYTFNEPVTLNGAASSYLSDFMLGPDTQPIAAVVETNGFIVEADFLPSVNVGQFAQASVGAGAVVSRQGSVANSPGSAGLTITTHGATAGPDLRGADVPGDPAASAPATNQVIYYFDKPIETAVPGGFGIFLPGGSAPVMGASIPSGGFTPGSTVVTIAFPVVSTNGTASEFVLDGAVTGTTGLANPEGVQGGNVAGVPGLLSAGSEWVASVTRVSATTYDFTFNQPPASVTPSDFSLYTASDNRLVGATATLSGQTVQVTFPAVTASDDVVQGTVLPGAIVSSAGVPGSAGQEPIGPAAGNFTGTAAERGVGFTPTGPSITNNPAKLRDAACAPGDNPETGLQGQVPPSVRAAGFKGVQLQPERARSVPRRGRHLGRRDVGGQLGQELCLPVYPGSWRDGH